MLALVALAAASPLFYDLAIGGETAGSRIVEIRYLAREDGERRVLSVYTELTAAGMKVACRETGASSPRGANFNASTQVGTSVVQVQGIELPGGGWRLTRADKDGVHESNLSAKEARLTTLDLLDPGRTGLLGTAGPVGIVVAETGDLLAGNLAAGTPVSVKVGGKNLAATRYVVEGDAGQARFDVDGDGVLLRSELRVFGVDVVATLRNAPPPRNYGTVDTIDTMGSGVSEEGL